MMRAMALEMEEMMPWILLSLQLLLLLLLPLLLLRLLLLSQEGM
jgi:hypothetical protein